MARNKIGVLVLVKNEELNIDACLESCSFADEIVVVDSYSTDKTVAIAKTHTENIFQKEFVNFLDQRLFGIKKISSEWLLMIDADERVSDALKKELVAFASQDEYSAMEIPRRNYLLGGWVKFSGWYPDYQTRFIKKNTITNEQKIVHEKFDSSGNKKRILESSAACIYHNTCDSVFEYINKINKYTALEAEYFLDKNEFKITRWAIFTRSMGMFTQTLFHHKGIKDGMRGFVVAGFNFIYSFLMMIKVWELKNKKKF